jgi:hypothetical protein
MRDDHARRDSERPSARPSSDDLREYLPARDARDMKAAGADDAKPVTKPARAKPAPGSAKRTHPAVLAAAVLAVVGPLLVGSVVIERKTDAKIAAALAKARAEAPAPSIGAASALAARKGSEARTAPAPSAAPAASTGAAPEGTAGALVPPRAPRSQEKPRGALDPYDDAAPPPPASASAPPEPHPTSAPQAPTSQPSTTPNGDVYFRKRD